MVELTFCIIFKPCVTSVSKSVYQIQAENQQQMLETEIEELRAINEKLQMKIALGRKAGKNVEEQETHLKSNNELIIKKIGQIEKAKENAKEATNASLDLFAQAETVVKPTETVKEKPKGTIEDRLKALKILLSKSPKNEIIKNRVVALSNISKLKSK